MIETCAGRALSVCLLSCYACCDDVYECDDEKGRYTQASQGESDEEMLGPEREW